MQYLESKQTSIEYDDIADSFKFIQPNGTLKLILETTQLQLGWTVNPDREPMEVCVYAYSQIMQYYCVSLL